MAINQSSVARPPKVGEVYSGANTTGVVVFPVPKAWYDRHVRFYTTGADIFLTTGDNANINASNTANGAAANGNFAPSGDAAPKVAIANGYSLPYFFTRDITHFAIYATAATGNWQAHVVDYGPGVPR